MASARTIMVNDAAHLPSVIDGLVVQGYSVASRDAFSVTMVKRKQFNVIWAVIGFFFCLLPLLIYLIVYATQQDEVVFIRVAAPAPALDGSASPLSPDRKFWWDGAAWHDADVEAPPGARRSDDGAYWWDGVEWRTIRAG